MCEHRIYHPTASCRIARSYVHFRLPDLFLPGLDNCSGSHRPKFPLKGYDCLCFYQYEAFWCPCRLVGGDWLQLLNKTQPMNYHLTKYNLDISTLWLSRFPPVSTTVLSFHPCRFHAWLQSYTPLRCRFYRPDTSFVLLSISLRHFSSPQFPQWLREADFRRALAQYNPQDKTHSYLRRR